MLGTALQLARKDLLLFVRDRTALALTFVLPLVLGSIFGSAMGSMSGGGGGGGTPKVDLAVEDRDQTAQSRALLAALEAASGLRVSVVDDARRPVADGDQASGLVVPEGYGDALTSGAQPVLPLYRDPSRTISQQVVLFQLAPVLFEQQAAALGAGMMDRVVSLLELPAPARDGASAALRESFESIDALMSDLAASGERESESDETADTGGFDPLEALPSALGLAPEDVAGIGDGGLPRNAGASHAFAAMAVMMLLFSVVGAGGTLLQERSDGTLVRLQLTPAAGRAVLTGKLVACGVIALAQLAVLFVYGAIVFDVPAFEAPLLLGAVSLVWVYLALGIGLMFAVLCRSQKQLEGLSTLVILVMSAVGGAWFPREVAPEWFRAVGGLTPVGWAMDAYHGVLWYGRGLFADGDRSGVAPTLAVMLVAGSALLGVAYAGYRRRYAAA